MLKDNAIDQAAPSIPSKGSNPVKIQDASATYQMDGRPEQVHALGEVIEPGNITEARTQHTDPYLSQ